LFTLEGDCGDHPVCGREPVRHHQHDLAHLHARHVHTLPGFDKSNLLKHVLPNLLSLPDFPKLTYFTRFHQSKMFVCLMKWWKSKINTYSLFKVEMTFPTFSFSEHFYIYAENCLPQVDRHLAHLLSRRSLCHFHRSNLLGVGTRKKREK